jgi:hypothetical protein
MMFETQTGIQERIEQSVTNYRGYINPPLHSEQQEKLGTHSENGGIQLYVAWESFWTEAKITRFGSNNLYWGQTIIDGDSGEIVFRSDVCSRDRDLAKLCFKLFLQEEGFVQDDTNPLLGSEFEGNRLQGWVRYGNQGGDLWVNLEDDFDSEWPADVMVTSQPRQIRIPHPKNYALAEAFSRIRNSV